MLVYKACQNSIVTLQLLEDSKTNENREGVVNPKYAKFRTNKAKVIRLVNPVNGEKLETDRSIFDPAFIYRKGEIVEEPDYNENDYSETDELTLKGIYFFKTYEAALSWFYRENGKLNGEFFTYNADGSLFGLNNYKNGEKEGKQYIWYTNGHLWYEKNYKDGGKDGKQYIYFENGDKMCEENYKSGKLDGKQYWWNRYGEKSKSEYIDGFRIFR